MTEQRTKIIIETDAGRSEQVLRSVQNGLKGVDAEAGKAARGVKDSSGTMDSSFLKTALSAAALGAAFKTAFSMAKEAANLSEARLLLETFTAGIGMSYDQLNETTKKASGGMVDNLTLIRANHKALKLGVSTDVGEIARLWEISQSVGDEFGQSIEQTFEQITDAISKGSAKSLISIGVLPESFKKASGAAGLLEQRTKLLSAVLDQAGASANRMSGVGDTAADKFDRLDTSVKDLKLQLGEAMIDAFMPTVDWLNNDLAPALTTSIDYWREWLGLMDTAKSKYASQGAAGQLGAISERQSQLKDRSSALNTAASADGYGPRRQALADIGIELDWTDDYVKIIDAEKNKVELELRGLAIQKEKIKQSAEITRETEKTVITQRAVVTATEEEGNAKTKVTDAQKALNKAEEESAKLIAQASEAFTDGFGVKTIGNLKEAENLLTSMVAACGGFAIGLKDGTTEAGKLLEESEKGSKKFEELNTNIISTLSGAGHNWSKELASLSPENAVTGMMNFATGGLFTAAGGDIKDSIKDIKEPLSKTIAEAVQAGFANTDFSNLSRTLGDILGSVFSRSVAQSNPIMDAAGSISFGNLGINLATDFAAKVLTQPGRFFGGREEHGTEAIQQAATLKDKMSEAYTSSYLSEINSVYATQAQRDAVNAARNGFFGTSTGTTWNDSGDGVRSDRTRTYALIDNGASAALKTLTDAMERVETYSSNTESLYKLKSAEGYDYKVLTDQVDIYKTALSHQYFGNGQLNWTDGSQSSKVDLTAATREIQTALAEMVRELGSATAERTNATAQGFAKYAPWLSTIQKGANDPGSIMDMINYPKSMTQPGVVSTSGMTTSDKYDAFSSLQTGFMDRNISPYLLDMVKQAGTAKYDLEKLRVTGSEDYSEKYLEYVEKQVAAFEEVMKRQEEIFNDATKTFEERSAALVTYESAFEAYNQANLDAIVADEAAKEVIKQKEQEAAVRSRDKMAAALNIYGEISQAGTKIYVLTGGKRDIAYAELIKQNADNPAVISALNAADAHNQGMVLWGEK